MTSHVIHRSFQWDFPVAVSGDGAYIVDSNGRRYLDASGGAAVSCIGHAHPQVIRAIAEQARKLEFAHTSFFTNEPLEKLAEFLIRKAGGGVERAGIVCDGSEAIEAAIKLARQYWTESGQGSRSVIISRRLSYHGITLGALSVSGHTSRREKYLPYLSSNVEFIAPCYAYRGRLSHESETDYSARVANELEEAIVRIGPERVSAFIAEIVGGSTAGCLTPVPGYFRRIREICDRYDVFFIADEVMCGMGRTGTLFAYEQEGVTPDLIAIGKGLAGGYQPIGAVLANGRITRAIEAGSGLLAQGHTYMGHPIACAAAVAVQQVIEGEHLLENVQNMGRMLERSLRERFESHPHVGDIRGRGLFWALELVKDKNEKRPFAPSLKLAARIKRAAFERGLICYPSPGAADGSCGDHVLLAPPYIINEADIEEMVDILGETIVWVLSNEL